MEPPVDARRVDPGLAQEPARLAVVGGRELEVDRAGGAALEQLELDLADPAADLEHGRVRDPLALEEGDDPRRRLVEAALAVLRGDPPRELASEEVVAPAWVAAVHDPHYWHLRID